MFSLSSKGDFAKTEKWLRANSQPVINLRPYAEQGLRELVKRTPKDSGVSAASWRFEIQAVSNGQVITWYNDSVDDEFMVVLGIEFGHGTGNGGYVMARPFIDSSIEPIFKKMGAEIIKEVSK